MPLATYEHKEAGLESTELPVDFLHTPELILAQYGDKQHLIDPVCYQGFATSGATISPDELKFLTMMVLVPGYTIKKGVKPGQIKTEDLSINVLQDPSILDVEAKLMANKTSTDARGFTRRPVKINKPSDVSGDYLKKQIYLHQYIEDHIKSRQWNFIKDFDLDPDNRRWLIRFEAEVLETILPLFKSYIDIERIGHSTPKGLIELPIGLGGPSGRPGPIYQVPGFRGTYQKLTPPYIITRKDQLIAAQGAVFSYFQMTNSLSEYGLIKGSRLIDTLLRNGLYGTLDLMDVIHLIPLFSRCGISPGIYHLASTLRSKKQIIMALELFLMRVWILLYYVQMLKVSGVDNLQTEVTYKFQGRTPPSQEILDQAFMRGLHPLEDSHRISGLVNYYYPPAASGHLKNGMYRLISDNQKFKNSVNVQSALRPSKVRSELVKENDIYATFPNLVEEQVDYAIIVPLNEAQEYLKRELYGSPQEFDEFTVAGRITTTNGYSSKQAAMKLIDTLLIGGQPMCDWDQMYRPINTTYKSKNVKRNFITAEYDRLERKQLQYAEYLQEKYIMEGGRYYYGLARSSINTIMDMSPAEKAQLYKFMGGQNVQVSPKVAEAATEMRKNFLDSISHAIDAITRGEQDAE